MASLVSSAAVYCLLLVCAGCAQTVAVNVSGTSKSAEPIPQHVTYTVLPTIEVENDEAFPRYASLVSSKMDARGYKKTTKNTAQLGVFLAYSSTAGTTHSGSGGAAPIGAAGGMSSTGSAGGSYGVSTESASRSTGARRYNNQLVIVVVDLEKSRGSEALVELWRGETMNTGRSNDLDQLAPLMVDAAFQHFGEATSNSVRHVFTEEEIQNRPALR